ncbi:MAG: IS110 family transposase [Candidatus Omnitrophota bacterium]
MENVKTFIGIDLHKDSLTWSARNSAGEEIGIGKIPTKCREKIVGFIQDWPRPVSVSFEAVGFYRWLWLLLEPHVDSLCLADAGRLRAMADRNVKTDFKDARLISKVLWRGEIPTSFVVGEPFYTLRQQLRHRHDLSRRAARTKSSMKRICLRANLPGPKALIGARAVAYFDAYGNRLHPMDRERWLDLTDQLLLLERQLAGTDRNLFLRIESLPEICQDIDRLATAPGVGVLTAATVLMETGGLSRFTHPEQLACYSGLTTRTFQSADTVRHGHISKAGPPNLRWVLQQASWCAIRTNPYVRGIHNRISRRAGSKKAATAIARRLLIWLWAMHTKQTEWKKEADKSLSPAYLKEYSLAEA